MTADRWEKIERIYREAAARPPSQRQRFLDEACSADRDLRGEVERMLSGEAKLGGFMETPAAQVAARDLVRDRLSPGALLGAYEIVELLGAGGMGEVYKARDSRLSRLVAVKVLPECAASDADKRKRLLREARMASALNHPNIVTIHEVGSEGGVDFVAMEYVSGRRLDARIGDKGLPLAEALDYAVQIADALCAAQEAGIVHRDLKPGNIVITEQGRVKVLDFGLAKATDASPAGERSQLETRPMEESLLTEPGVIVGTLAYMSPEQVKGQPADSRSDIFAFGVVLYEMITGRPAFRGGSRIETIAAVLQQDPKPAREIVPGLPAQVGKILGHCLEKDPRRRFQHMADVARLLEDARDAVRQGGSALEPRQSEPSLRRYAAPVLAGGLLIALAAAAIWRFGGSSGVERGANSAEPIRFTVTLPSGTTLVSAPQLSPDGRRFVCIAIGGADRRPAIYLHSLESGAGQILPGTESGISPSWSPDGKSILFIAGGELRKLDLSGGSIPVSLGRIGPAFGADWSAGSVILLGNYPGGIRQLSAAGGAIRPVTALDPSHHEIGHVFPQFLPGGNRFLYLARSQVAGESAIYVASLDGKLRKRILQTESRAQFVAVAGGRSSAGYLLYIRDGNLVAQPFDSDRLELAGEPRQLAAGITLRPYGEAMYSASATGVLAYRTGEAQSAQLTWFDRSGKAADAIGPIGDIGDPAISPDGKRVAFDRAEGSNRDIWTIEIATGKLLRLTYDPEVDHDPIWSPAGDRIAFDSHRNPQGLYVADAAKAGAESLAVPGGDGPSSWTPDGRFLVFDSMRSVREPPHIWLSPLEGDRKARRWLNSSTAERWPQVSPDGKWVAYVSNETGQNEIYVIPFHEGSPSAGKWQVSAGGGSQPAWRADGRELYYLSQERVLMAVAVKPGDAFNYGRPVTLFDPRLGILRGPRNEYATHDGKRFLFRVPVQSEPSPVHLVVNWPAAVGR
jgi:serine/threonine protein kinase/Tol biopolymer transport system component